MTRRKHTDEATATAEPAAQPDKSKPKTSSKAPRKGNPNWRKGGPSPNPKGRPKTRWELAETIQRRGDELMKALFDIVDECPVRTPRESDEGKTIIDVVGPSHRERIEAAKVLIAYGYGKPTQTVEVSGPNGGPVQTKIDVTKVSDEDLRAIRRVRQAAKGDAG